VWLAGLAAAIGRRLQERIATDARHATGCKGASQGSREGCLPKCASRAEYVARRLMLSLHGSTSKRAKALFVGLSGFEGEGRNIRNSVASSPRLFAPR